MDDSVIFMGEIRAGYDDICVLDEENTTENLIRPLRRNCRRLPEEPLEPSISVDLSRDSGEFAQPAQTNPKNLKTDNAKEKSTDNLENKSDPLECPICLDSLNNLEVRITNCGHLFCKPCMEHLFKEKTAKCPKCRKSIVKKTIRPVYF